MFLAMAVLLIAMPAATGESVTPVQKVLQMMADMKAKGLKEKDAEIVTFKTFTQFCKDTMAAKEKSVADASDEMDQLAADIERYNADASILGKEINKLDKALDKAQTQKDASTAKFEVEEEDYKSLHAEYEINIADIQVGTAQLKAMMAASSASAASASMIQQMASRSRLPARAKKVLQSLLQTSSSTGLEQSAPEGAAFESQSGGVVELMNGLTEKMEGEKTKLEQQFVKSRGAYQMIQQTLTDQIDQHSTVRNNKAGTKKGKESSSAEAAAERSSTETSKASDQAFLNDLYSECATKSSEYESNQKIRAGEIVALNKAIEIIAGGAVSGASEKHLPQLMQSSAAALVQLRNGGSSTRPSQSVAASFLQAQGKQMGSRLLSNLSLRVAEDPFGKVKKMIQDMVYKLMEEANEEATHKGFCDTELGTNKNTRDQKTTTASELTASIEEMSSQISILSDQISEVSEQVTEIDTSVAKASAIRADEKAKNSETITEAIQASTAVKQALSVLQAYYDGLSLLQKSGTASRNPAQSGASTGVIGMLEVILSDFQRLESSTKASDETNEASHEKFMNDSSQDKAVKQAHIKNKSESRSETDINMKQAQKDLTSTQAELKAAEAYFEKLRPACVESGNSYEDRVAARKLEIESLQEAIKILDENDIA